MRTNSVLLRKLDRALGELLGEAPPPGFRGKPEEQGDPEIGVRKPAHGNVGSTVRAHKANQEELADKVGIGPAAMSMLVTGKRSPSVKTARKLQRALHVPLDAVVPNV